MQQRIVVRKDRNHPALEGDRQSLIRNGVARFGFNQSLLVGPVICYDEGLTVHLRRNAVDDQHRAVSQGPPQHDFKHWVRRHEAALAGVLPIGQVSFVPCR
jgi:hypothetical protein